MCLCGALRCCGAYAVTAVTRGARFCNPQDVDFLTTAFAPMPVAPDVQNTSRARMADVAGGWVGEEGEGRGQDVVP